MPSSAKSGSESAGSASESTPISPSGVAKAGRMLHEYAEEDKAQEIDELLSRVAPEKKADVIDFQNSDKQTALWKCAKVGYVESAAVLLRHGASLNVQSKFGEVSLQPFVSPSTFLHPTPRHATP